MTHVMEQDLAWSQAQSSDPMWERIYRLAFPDFVAMRTAHQDMEYQRAGIDRLVELSTSRIVKIDEKVRRKEWADFFLEYISHGDKPGWVVKPLLCDYIAYAWVPKKIGYLLPVLELQRAWRERGDRWIELGKRRQHGFDHKLIKNTPLNGSSYTTVGVCVPIAVCLDAIRNAMVVRW